MPLRIGFDLDGVLADMDAELLRIATDLFGELQPRRRRDGLTPGVGQGEAGEASREAAADARVRQLGHFDLTSRQHRRLWNAVSEVENFWEGLVDLEPGVIERLGALAATRHWDIIFLTKRPRTSGAT